MKLKEYETYVKSLDDYDDYGLCPSPISADKAMNILIDHFLGEDWYVSMPLSNEQVYTEALYIILNKTQKSFLRKLFELF